jgi:antitoxin HicB
MALSIEMDERRMVAQASKAMKEKYLGCLPVLMAMKAILHNSMIETVTQRAYLARRMNLKGPQVGCLLDLHHPSKVESVEHAIHQLGRTVKLGLVEVYKPNKPA